MSKTLNNGYEELSLRRNCPYNSIVSINNFHLTNLVNGFDDIFDFITNPTESISSVKFFMIKPNSIGTENYRLHIAEKGYTVRANQIVNGIRYIYYGCKKIEPLFNNFMDYSGYTKIQVFLPLLGYVDVDTNECMNKYLNIRLIIDYYTGMGLYILGVSDEFIHDYTDLTLISDKEKETLMSDFRVLSVFEVPMSVDIPLGSSNFGDITRNILMSTIKTASSTANILSSNLAESIGTKTVTTSTYHNEVKSRGAEPYSRLKTTTSWDATQKTEETKIRPVNHYKPIAETIEGSIDSLNRSFPSGHSDRCSNSALTIGFSRNPIITIYRPRATYLDKNVFAELYGLPLGSVINLGTITGKTIISAVEIKGEDFERCTMKELEMLNLALAEDIIL